MPIWLPQQPHRDSPFSHEPALHLIFGQAGNPVRRAREGLAVVTTPQKKKKTPAPKRREAPELRHLMLAAWAGYHLDVLLGAVRGIKDLDKRHGRFASWHADALKDLGEVIGETPAHGMFHRVGPKPLDGYHADIDEVIQQEVRAQVMLFRLAGKA